MPNEDQVGPLCGGRMVTCVPTAAELGVHIGMGLLRFANTQPGPLLASSFTDKPWDKPGHDDRAWVGQRPV